MMEGRLGTVIEEGRVYVSAADLVRLCDKVASMLECPCEREGVDMVAGLVTTTMNIVQAADDPDL